MKAQIMKRIAIAAALTLLWASQSGAETIAIRGARIQTMGPAGEIASGTIVVVDGRIAAVGADAAIPPGARVIDGSGLVVTPGLFATMAAIAVQDLVGYSVGGVGSRSDVVSASFDVQYEINPASPQIPEARIEGVTHAVVTPNPLVSGRAGTQGVGIFSGRAAVIHLGHTANLIVRPGAAMVMDGGEVGGQFAGGGPGALFTVLRQILADSRALAANPAAFDEGRMRALLLSRNDLEALVPVAQGRQLLLIEVNRAADIRNVLAFAREQNLRIALTGAAEAWMVADEIRAAQIPVILDAEDNEAYGWEDLNATYENAGRLIRAGVTVAFEPAISRTMVLNRSPRLVAGRSVRFGVTRQEALAAITINPARIFGIADRVGSIERGKEASFVLWSGDPLDTDGVVRRVFIRGEEQPMDARSRQLRDRYIGAIREQAR